MSIVRRVPKRVSDEDLLAYLKLFFDESEVGPNGGVVLKMWDFDHLEEILPDAFELPPSFSRKQAGSILHWALLACRKENRCEIDQLLLHANTHAKEFLLKELNSYTMWTKFRAKQMPFHKSFNMSWNGVRVRTSASLPKYLRLKEYRLSGFGHIDPQPPSFYGYIILSCDERDDTSAATKMLDALQLIYGVINIYETFGRYTHYSGAYWTEGPMWLGPYQFMFQRKTFLGKNRIWYNPDYLPAAWDRNPISMERVLIVVPRVRKALNTLATHPLRSVLENAIVTMQDGFASRDASHRILRYWSALEQLYSADPRNRNQRQIVQRATFADPEPWLERWKLNHAASLRNEHVHGSGVDAEMKASTQDLRQLLCRHINHIIFTRGDLRNHAEWLDLVDLPRDEQRLHQFKNMLDKRLTYFSSTEA